MAALMPATAEQTLSAEQSARLDLWELDLTPLGGERFFLCNQVNELGKPVVWQGREYTPYPVQAQDYQTNSKGPAGRPTLTVANLFGLVTGMAEELQSAAGAVVVRRIVYARFLDEVNFAAGNPHADPEQEAVARYIIEQLAEMTAAAATFVLAAPTETEGLLFPGRIMLADICPWRYRSAECGYHGAPVADVYGKPTSDPRRDNCGNCPAGCRLRNNTANYGGFISINKLSG